MIAIPNLAGVATHDLVDHIGNGSFRASYINWSRTMHLLRQHAPGWLPEMVPTAEGGLLHAAPVGCYLLIRFRLGEIATPAVPQAVMDTRNAAIAREKITARDVTDTHRRGVCMAAAFTFGLAYELWAKLPLESGHHEHAAKGVIKATDGAGEGIGADRKAELDELALYMIECHKEGKDGDAIRVWYAEDTFADNEERIYVWSLLGAESKLRSTVKANKPEKVAA